jgi:hypothetical protein
LEEIGFENFNIFVNNKTSVELSKVLGTFGGKMNWFRSQRKKKKSSKERERSWFGSNTWLTPRPSKNGEDELQPKISMSLQWLLNDQKKKKSWEEMPLPPPRHLQTPMRMKTFLTQEVVVV